MSWPKRRKVVVPVDYSENSVEAIRTALAFVDDSSDVKAIHVLAPLDHVSPGVVWGKVNDESREEAVREFTEEFLASHDLAKVELSVRIGSPGLEVVDFAAAINADLIVVPSHGHHGFKRLMLGSVAESITRHAHCPVLVLRRNADD